MSNSKRKAHCGKVKHHSLQAAQIALERTIRSTNKKNPIVTDLTPYKCPYCGSWHIGRSQKKGINWDRFAHFERALKEQCAATAKANAYSKGVSANSNAPFSGASELVKMAEWTGLEPATPGVTGRSLK